MKAAAVRVLPVPVAISKLAFAPGDFSAKRVDTILLVITARNVRVDCYGKRVLLHLARGEALFEVRLLEKGFDGARVGFAFPLPEPELLAVGEKDIGNAELLRIGPGLLDSVTRANRKAFCFNDGHGAAIAVAEHIIRSRLVR
jgi:hypothetical protein